MSESTLNVASDEYDGRNFVHGDNSEGVEHFVGVDPIYQNYANEGERPHPFTVEQLDEAAIKGGLDPDDDYFEEVDEPSESPEAPSAAKVQTPPPPAPAAATKAAPKTAAK